MRMLIRRNGKDDAFEEDFTYLIKKQAPFFAALQYIASTVDR